MADYSVQQGRNFARPGQFGPATAYQRDAAYSSIFGAALPPGRSQTMSSAASSPSPERAQATTSPPGHIMRRSPSAQPYPTTFKANLPSPDGYRESQGQAGGPYHPQNQPRTGIQTQRMAQALLPDRRPCPMPQRTDDGQAPQHQANGLLPKRGYGAPALYSDNYRSQSMAGIGRPTGLQQTVSSYNMAPAHVLRQQPYLNYLAKTTAQGRVVPERHDERTMSMSSFARDSDHTQTMSGRIIPNRRRESSHEYIAQDRPYVNGSMAAQSRPPKSSPSAKTRSTSQGSIPASRTTSMASTVVSPSEVNGVSSYRLGIVKSNSQSTATNPVMISQRKRPLVAPAMLSLVADAFRTRIQLGDREKDGLVYKMAFTGMEAVDTIAFVIKTSDRNLALLLGRSLDAQKLFHDVTYEHRLRDSHSEVYQFRETLMDDNTEVNGVFTLLTECYSPTCTPDQLCYSIACPRRLEQSRNAAEREGVGMQRKGSSASLRGVQNDEQKLWINTVSQEVADSVSDREKKRQEVISEIMYTERDFVKDLEYLRDFWMKPLRSTNPARPSPIPEHRREKFVRTVFSNCQEIYAVNSRLADALTRRQAQNAVVHNVGDIFLEFIPRFGPFIKYGASQLFGKYEFEKEKNLNPAFSRFVDETERLKESRKLELNGYLTKPTTRLARYPLLLENVHKCTADDNPDKEDIPKAIAGIKEFLSKVNVESGRAENAFNLMQLSQSLKFRPGEYVDLKLTDEGRQLVFKGALKKSPTDSNADIQAFLFDHSVLLVRVKMVNKREDLKVYKKPIPLELLVVTEMDQLTPKLGLAKRPSSGLIPGTKPSSTLNAPRLDQVRQQGYPITFKHLGRGGYEQTFYCASAIQRQKWLENIENQQKQLRQKSHIFTKTIINRAYFNYANRVNCCVPTDGGRKLVFGTDLGVYVLDRKPKDESGQPKKVLDVRAVTQVDVLEQHSILLVLSDKTLYSYPVEALDPEDRHTAITKRGTKVCHANFFKAGVCAGQHLVTAAKLSSLSTTVKVFEPMDSVVKNKKKSGFAKMLSGGQEQMLRSLKEFYIPTDATSIHFLRSKLCVGCAKGFEVVALDTLETQPLLDQADTSLDFVARKENIKPIHMERLTSEFLLCYTEFSFFVNRNGWRARPDWKICWEGNPQAFAIFNPYILAFEPSFVEMRHMDTGHLVNITTGKNIRMLHSSTREILYAYEDEYGDDVIASLDFWGRPQ